MRENAERFDPHGVYKEPRYVFWRAAGLIFLLGAGASVMYFDRTYERVNDILLDIPAIDFNIGETNPLWGVLYDGQSKQYTVRDVYQGTLIPVVELDSNGRHTVGYVVPGTEIQSQGIARGPVYDVFGPDEQSMAIFEYEGQKFARWVQIGETTPLVDRFGKPLKPHLENSPKFMRRTDLVEAPRIANQDSGK